MTHNNLFTWTLISNCDSIKLKKKNQTMPGWFHDGPQPPPASYLPSSQWFNQTPIQMLLWRDFADGSKVSNQLTLRHGDYPGLDCLNQVSPDEVFFLRKDIQRVRGIQCEGFSPLQALKMEEPHGKECWWPLGIETSPPPAPYWQLWRKQGAQSHNWKKLNSVNSLYISLEEDTELKMRT